MNEPTRQPHVDTAPSALEIGPHRYALGWSIPGHDGLESDLRGRCQCERLQINIDPMLPMSRIAETFLHEVIHAIVNNAGLSGQTEEENYVQASAIGLTDFWKRNSAALTWWLSLIEENEE